MLKGKHFRNYRRFFKKLKCDLGSYHIHLAIYSQRAINWDRKTFLVKALLKQENMKTRKLLLTGMAVLCTFLGISQSLIKNSDFEMHNSAVTFDGSPGSFDVKVDHWDYGCEESSLGYPGSPDYFRTESACHYNVPINKFSTSRTVNTGGSAYVGFFPQESIIGELEETLGNCQYKIAFWIAPSGGVHGCSGTVGTPPTSNVSTQFELVLRHPNNPCNSGEVVWTSDPVNLNSDVDAPWQLVEGTFIPSSNAINQAYSKIEIRQKDQEGSWVYLDDVSLESDSDVEANTVPVNHTGIDVELVGDNLAEVIKFCEGDPILFDGTGSQNENSYHLTVNPVLSNGSIGNTIYEDWVATPAHNNIDLTNPFGSPYSFVTGQHYLLRFAVGPCWDEEFYYFKVEECCPDELVLELDCENGTISIVNIPSSASNIDVDWSWSGSTKPLKENGTVLTILNGYGNYSASVSYTMPNGDVCHLGANIEYSSEVCCDILGPHFTTPGIIEGDYNQVFTNPYGMIEYSIVNCRPRLELEADCETQYYIAIEPWIPLDWTSDPNGGVGASFIVNGTLPSALDLSTLYSFSPNQFYHITVGIQNQTNPQFQWNFKHFLIETNNCEIKREASSDDSIMEMASFEVSVIPNPATDRISVTLNEVSSGTIEIISMNGKTLITQTFDEQNDIQLNLKELSAGMYQLRMASDLGVVTKSIFVQ